MTARATATATTRAAAYPIHARKEIPVRARPHTARIRVIPAKTMPAPEVPAVRPAASATGNPRASSERCRTTKKSA